MVTMAMGNMWRTVRRGVLDKITYGVVYGGVYFCAFLVVVFLGSWLLLSLCEGENSDAQFS